MSYQLLDHIADSFNPLLALALICAALWWKKLDSWEFLLRGSLALGVCWLLAKYIQRHQDFTASHFPSTHYAVTLCLLTSFIVLRPWSAALLIPLCLGYGWLVVFQQYHVTFDLVGAGFVVPLTVLMHWKPRRRNPDRAQISLDIIARP